MSPPEADRDLAERIDEKVRAGDFGPGAEAELQPGGFVDRVAELVAVILLGVIVLLIFLNAFFRYSFANPLVWTEEIVSSLIIWLAVAGAFLALRRRQLITIEVVTKRLPEVPRTVLGITMQLASAFVLAWLAWLGWRYMGLFGKDTTPFFGFPKAFYMAAIPVGIGVMAIACLLPVISSRIQRRRARC